MAAPHIGADRPLTHADSTTTLAPSVPPTTTTPIQELDSPKEVKHIADSNKNPTTNAATTVEDEAPDGGYGWVCTFCSFMIHANTWGIGAPWGIFLDRYVAQGTFAQVGKFEYAIVGGLAIALALMVAPLANCCKRVLGTRWTILLGSVITSAGIFASSAASQVWHLVLSYGLCYGLGMGILYIPSISVVGPWFSTHRSLAIGIASAGSGFGGLAYSLLAGKLIATYGIPWTWRIMSFTTFFCNVICGLLIKDSPVMKSVASSTSTSKPSSFCFHIFTRPQVILILVWGFIAELGYVSLYFSLPSYATTLGLDLTQGSIVQALMSLGAAIGRPCVGWVSDRLGRINVALFMTLFCGLISLALWIQARSYVPLLVFAVLSGISSGTFWSTANPIVTEVVGMRESAATYSAVCLVMALPATFGEAIALQFVDESRTDNAKFLPSQVYVGCTYFAGAVALLMLRGWRVWELQKKSALVEDPEVAGEKDILPKEKRGYGWMKPGVWIKGLRV
ncbi:major facilitator superfamily domain-containing protein [Triangularia verruculosa]|uniref:Major facilitator superfamily domain-containing protein n=1 Tax=Triangularia verruculosa TaxID=2587418 RepID=A0AAN6X8W9_9PEZI|nr:major facilitator superfamily domain-containing protein [Triangularia verruculosa]